MAATEEDQSPANLVTSNALVGRELEWAVNSPELLAEHAAINHGIIRTRFPVSRELSLCFSFFIMMHKNLHSFDPLIIARTKWLSTHWTCQVNEYEFSISV